MKVLDENREEIDMRETVDYTESTIRYDLEDGKGGYNYGEEESLASMGYQKQEFDEESQELVSVEDDSDFSDDFAMEDASFEDSYDE